MKKIILSIAMVAMTAFVGCSDNEETTKNCASCDTANIEVCDNGDGTASISILGQPQDDVPLPEGTTVQDIADGFCSVAVGN